MKRLIALFIAAMLLTACRSAQTLVTTAEQTEVHEEGTLQASEKAQADLSVVVDSSRVDNSTIEVSIITFAPPQGDDTSSRASPAAEVTLPNGTSVKGNIAQLQQIRKQTSSAAQSTTTAQAHEESESSLSASEELDVSDSTAQESEARVPRDKKMSAGEVVFLVSLILLIVACVVYLRRHR